MRVYEKVIHSQHRHPLLFSHRSIKVLSWNIAKQNHDQRWLSDIQTLLAEHQPDVIFLQEVNLCSRMQQVAGLEEMNWHFAPNFIDGHSAAYAGILTAAKSTHLETQSILTQDYEPITNTPKISLLSHYPLPGSSTSLLTVNIHGINFVDLKAFEAQLKQLSIAISAHSGPVIFSGDFNTWNQSRWQSLRQVTQQLSLHPVRFSREETKKIKRFLLSPPLDHIFYKELTMKPVTARVFDHIFSSDHKPIFVEFSW